MKTYRIFLIEILLAAQFITCLNAQQGARIFGFVKDRLTGEVLIGANIIEYGTRNGTVSDYHGFFSIMVQIPSAIEVTYVGYGKYTLNIENRKDTLVQVFLVPASELEEVVIMAQRIPHFNVSSLDSRELQQIPSLGGKPDVVKSLQLLPGIGTQNEGSGLLLVRGGDPGQNLYLFDNIPVIYVNHLGGFTSVFNPDIINNIDVYKGGFPSRYGGKLSSVVDITQKDGDISGLKGSLGIGVTDASFTAEGPMKLKNSGFIITGRKTLVDALMAGFTKFSEFNDFIIAYGFHDINAKFSWKPDFKNSLSLNLYQGDDYLNWWADKENDRPDEKNHIGYIWGNWLVSARWNSVVSSKLFGASSISYTRYRLKETAKYTLLNSSDTTNFRMKYLSSVQDISFRSGWKYIPIKGLELEYGLQSSLLFHVPNYTFRSEEDNTEGIHFITSVESALYFDGRLSLIPQVIFTPGIRIVNYNSQDYSDFSIEPRLNLNIAIHSDHIVNISYMKVTQFSHLILTAGNIMNNEIWIPSGREIPYSYSNQYTLGWKGSFSGNRYSTEADLYYKELFSLATYKEGYTSLQGDNNWRTKIETGGTGTAMGAEFLVKKNSGKLTGFASYSFSKATRQFPAINEGQEYIYEFDRPHKASIFLNYKLNEKLSFNATWIYQTGLPYTPAIGRRYTPSLEPDESGTMFYYEVMIYGDRNSERMKNYHRLDIGVNYTKITKGNRKAIWTISVYNAYNRKNPYYYYFNNNNAGEIFKPENNGEFTPLSLYQISFFPILPAISYKLFFNRNASMQARKTTTFKQKFIKWLYHEN